MAPGTAQLLSVLRLDSAAAGLLLDFCVIQRSAFKQACAQANLASKQACIATSNSRGVGRVLSRISPFSCVFNSAQSTIKRLPALRCVDVCSSCSGAVISWTPLLRPDAFLLSTANRMSDAARSWSLLSIRPLSGLRLNRGEKEGTTNGPVDGQKAIDWQESIQPQSFGGRSDWRWPVQQGVPRLNQPTTRTRWTRCGLLTMPGAHKPSPKRLTRQLCSPPRPVENNKSGSAELRAGSVR